MMNLLTRLRTISAHLLLTMVLLTFVGAGTFQATPANAAGSTASWQIVASPSPAAIFNVLGSVAAFSPDDVWAVGQAQYTTSVAVPLAEHWNGTTWSVVPVRLSRIGNAFNAVTTIPGTHDLWAVGNGGLAELWDGATWKITPTVTLNSPTFSSVFALSATSAWAVGNYYRSSLMPNAALIEYWDGARWYQVPAAYPPGSQHSFLNSITALSATDIWAVGSYDNGITSPGFTLVEHWNGTRWSLVSAPNPGPNNNILGNVTRVPDTDHLWATGLQFNGFQVQSLIEYWNGTTWSLVPAPLVGVGSQLSGVAALSENNAWVVGSYTDGQGDDYTLTEQWDGTAWNVVTSPNPTSLSFLYGLTKVPGSGTLWAVGSYYNSQNDQLTLTEQYS